MNWSLKPGSTPPAHLVWSLTALVVCLLMISACATPAPGSAPPRLSIPRSVAEPCTLYTLPTEPTQADLEVGYVMRGQQLVWCDGARDLAVQTMREEHRLEDEWIALRAERNRPWWRLW
jgi:hypothetical protein